MKIKHTISVIFVIVVVTALSAGVYVWNRLGSRYEGESVRIYLPSDISENDLRDSLKADLGRFGEDVFWAWNLLDAKLKKAHGSYVIAPGDKALDVARRLRSGSQTPIMITFNNVRTVDELARRLAAKMEWDSADFISACDSVLPARGYSRRQYPAAFLPDSYETFWTTSATDLVKRLTDSRDRFWTEQRLAKAKSLGLSATDVATVASIVEEETSKADERPKVARLYLNRLHRGMLLQADPTVKFAIGDFSLKRIYNSHLAVDSPYNTYKYIGLPPGPIRIPDQRTLDAVLDAPQHDYIYMCAKDDFSGYHNFARDLSTHILNASLYHKALRQRNIK